MSDRRAHRHRSPSISSDRQSTRHHRQSRHDRSRSPQPSTHHSFHNRRSRSRDRDRRRDHHDDRNRGHRAKAEDRDWRVRRADDQRRTADHDHESEYSRTDDSRAESKRAYTDRYDDRHAHPPPRSAHERLNHAEQAEPAARPRRSRFDAAPTSRLDDVPRSGAADPTLRPKPLSPGLSTSATAEPAVPPRRSRFDCQDAAAEVQSGTGPSRIPEESAEELKIRQRQERIAQWKKQKADAEASKARAAPPATLGSGTTASSTTTVKAPAGSKLSAGGFGKFGFSKKTETKVDRGRRVDVVSGKRSAEESFDFDALPHGVTEAARSKTAFDDEDEADPLEAFMAENNKQIKPYKLTRFDEPDGRVIEDDELLVSEDELEVEADILAMAARRANAKKKDIALVDHTKEHYEPFRKDFYVEPAEFSDLSTEEVEAMRLGLDGIAVRGRDCPKPVQNWGQCGLPGQVLDVIARLGYDHPTAIQAQAIPAVMSGRDTIGVAKTGSGKTVAFLLPMFRHIKDQRPLAPGQGPIALILTPTRELAAQIHKECRPFLKALDLRAVCAYGGTQISEQIAELRRGAEIVVCTPGRMVDLLAANNGRVTNLKRVSFCVLDEADRMFDMGFEPQVMRIVNNIQPQRQTVLFSATFPRQMEALARKVLKHKPIEIIVGGRSVVAPEITQIVEVRPPDPDSGRFSRVLELLGELYATDDDVRTLIFVDRQDGADNLLAMLMRKGYPCDALHGGKDQFDRDSTIQDFKNGVFPILIATSVAARGLDVKQLKLVINYDCPNHLEDYVHRVGRTGRAGQTGTAVTFVGRDQEKYAMMIAKALQLSGAAVPEELQQMASSFTEKVEAGTEKAGWGFGGKGLDKFDVARDSERKQQRKAFGDDDEQVDEEAQRRLEAENAREPSPSGSAQPAAVEEAEALVEGGSSTAADAPIKIERITKESRQTRVSQNLSKADGKPLDPVAAARARIEAINNRIRSGGRSVEQLTTSAPDAGEFRAMMEINDYPQKARWNVTNRTNIAKVLETTGTSITTQGQYVKPGSVAPAGVPKLYLLVEGSTEAVVREAVTELRRLLTEGTMADVDSSSRYKVV